MALFRAQAHQMDLIDCSEETRPASAPAVPGKHPGSAADPRCDAESGSAPRGAEVRGRLAADFGSVMAPDGPSRSENTEQVA
jgi:hypothetical protein